MTLALFLVYMKNISVDILLCKFSFCGLYLLLPTVPTAHWLPANQLNYCLKLTKYFSVKTERVILTLPSPAGQSTNSLAYVLTGQGCINLSLNLRYNVYINQNKQNTKERKINIRNSELMMLMYGFLPANLFLIV